jgi:hypothetical protein
MFQRPRIFGMPRLSGSMMGADDVEGCTFNFACGTCDGHGPTNPDTCGMLRDIGVGVTSGLIAAGIAGKVIFPGPTDIL